MNELADSQSPYLLQHAHNPVHWVPWNEKAWEAAQQQDKMIFLSVGYSTCHWCHVMERESFENEAIAAVMNEHFINIKVDREERPDVDLTYMTFVQATSGRGGWPMSVWLSPDLKPIYGGTYYPPADAHGRVGFPAICEKLADMWKNDRANLQQKSAELMEHLRISVDLGAPGETAPEFGTVAAKLYEQAVSAYDHHLGGFGGAPKFPRPSILAALWPVHEHLQKTGDSGADYTRQMIENTLDCMARGGMHDQLGGGFHRYSVDESWHVPHFEKMLYDQSQLAIAYTRAWQANPKALYKTTAEGIFHYVLRDLQHDAGGFFCGEDADSLETAGSQEKKEGAFYVWKAEEIDAILGKERGRIARYVFGATREGNVRPGSDPLGELKGVSVLIRNAGIKRTAEYWETTEEAVREAMETGKKLLFEAREKRPRPHLDDKIITAWNGQMISALAIGSTAFSDSTLLAAAIQCADFIRQEMWAKPGQLRRSYRLSVSDIFAFASDYAFLIQGLLDLYDACHDRRWLEWALTLQTEMDTACLDHENGGYFSTNQTGGASLLNIKEDYDGAEPSPNSVAALNLLRLGHLFKRPDYLAQADTIFCLFKAHLENSPFSMPQMAASLAFQAQEVWDFVAILDGTSDPVQSAQFLKTIRQSKKPSVLTVIRNQEDCSFFSQFSPVVANMTALNGQPTLYICQGETCRQPVTDLNGLSEEFGGKSDPLTIHEICPVGQPLCRPDCQQSCVAWKPLSLEKL